MHDFKLQLYLCLTQLKKHKTRGSDVKNKLFLFTWFVFFYNKAFAHMYIFMHIHLYNFCIYIHIPLAKQIWRFLKFHGQCRELQLKWFYNTNCGYTVEVTINNNINLGTTASYYFMFITNIFTKKTANRLIYSLFKFYLSFPIEKCPDNYNEKIVISEVYAFFVLQCIVSGL